MFPSGPWPTEVLVTGSGPNFNQAFVIGTARSPEARLRSWVSKHPKRPCQQGASIALKFYGIAGSSPGRIRRKLFQQIRERFKSWFVLERYNESLVAFALKHRLPLGDVLPPLSKYHGSSRYRDTPTCEGNAMRKLLATEAAVHAHASRQLDETLAEFRRAFDVDALGQDLRNALDGMMARGHVAQQQCHGHGHRDHLVGRRLRAQLRRPGVWTRKYGFGMKPAIRRWKHLKRRPAGTF